MPIFRLGSHVFPSKQDARKHIQVMLKGIIPLDHEILLALLKLHPSADRKIGCGVKRFFTRSHPDFPQSKTWWLERHDGTTTDWSYIQCFHPRSDTSKVLSVFREAVREQILDYYQEYKLNYQRSDGHIPCEESGEWIHALDCEVDHVLPFSVLVSNFLKQCPLSIPKPGKTYDGCIGPDITPYNELMHSFASYHAKHAILRVIAKERHQENTNKQRKDGSLIEIRKIIEELSLWKNIDDEEN